MTEGKPAHFIERVDSKAGRYYRVQIDGEIRHYPSVTSVLRIISKGDNLFDWYARVSANAMVSKLADAADVIPFWDGENYDRMINVSMSDVNAMYLHAIKAPTEYKERAGDIGSRAHEWIERKNAGLPLPELTDDIRVSIGSYHQWEEQVGLEIIDNEKQVYSAEYEYAGTIDAIARTRSGDLCVVDYKTGSVVGRESALQLAAYAQEHNEMYGTAIREGVIAHLPRNPARGFRSKWVGHMDSVFEGGFLPALRLWHFVDQNESKLWKE